MKNLKTLILGVTSASAVLLSACGPDLPSRGQEGETCMWVLLECGERGIESCCTPTQCTYRGSDGTDIPCNGTDCMAAAEQAAEYCKQ